MTLFTRNQEYVVCPHCGHEHGDAWEWCKSEYAERMTCEDCGHEFLFWAESTAEYVTKRPETETRS